MGCRNDHSMHATRRSGSPRTTRTSVDCSALVLRSVPDIVDRSKGVCGSRRAGVDFSSGGVCPTSGSHAAPKPSASKAWVVA